MIIYEARALDNGYYQGLLMLQQRGMEKHTQEFYVLAVVHESEITEFKEHQAWGLRPKGE